MERLTWTSTCVETQGTQPVITPAEFVQSSCKSTLLAMYANYLGRGFCPSQVATADAIMKKKYTIPTSPHPNCGPMSKINDNYCFKLFNWVVCYAVIDDWNIILGILQYK